MGQALVGVGLISSLMMVVDICEKIVQNLIYTGAHTRVHVKLGKLELYS